MPIVWRAAALADLAEIIGYVAVRDPAAARRLKARIEEATRLLATHPLLFRAGRVSGTREIVAHPNYIVVYRVADIGVEIVAVVHARQRYP